VLLIGLRFLVHKLPHPVTIVMSKNSAVMP
jgi:hypothetical protein